MVTEAPVAVAVGPVVSTPIVEEMTEAAGTLIPIAGPQPEVAETTHPEVVTTAATKQPQVIIESNVVVTQEVAEHAEPVVEPQGEMVDIEEIAEAVKVAVVESKVVTQLAALVAAEVTAEVETVTAIKPKIVVEHNHATASMIRASAPECVSEAPRHGDWQRPTSALEGKDTAGGHTATHHASAAPACPQPVE